MSVFREQRFSRDNPCPICGGFDGKVRGRGERCFGFFSSDRRYAHCTREECAGNLEVNRESETYAHRLDGPCNCGGTHAPVLPEQDQFRTSRRRRIADFSDASATYDYRDESGSVVYRIARWGFGRSKSIYPYRPTENGAWLLGIKGQRRVLYRLPEALAAIDAGTPIHVTEGEKKADLLVGLGLVATCSPFGAGKWRSEYTDSLRSAREVIVWADNDEKGRAHADSVARSLCDAAVPDVRVVLPPVEEGCGIDDLLARKPAPRLDELARLVAAAPLVVPQRSDCGGPVSRATGPWDVARDALDFVNAGEPDADWLVPGLIARGAVTAWYSPRGIGKTLVAHHIAVDLARTGVRVLLIDRDNPRREVRRRLREWGVDKIGRGLLRVISRDQAPPLTDKLKWSQFPVAEYDLVIIDSIDSATEGVGEADSGRPSLALAALLDVVRSTQGPGALVLGNTIKSGSHGRGSGVVEDRLDIVFEVRDATDFKPSGTKDWWLEMPPAGRDAWGTRAARRKKRDQFLLAFVPSKFRIGEEPDPFVLRICCTEAQWRCTNVTGDLVHQGALAKAEAEVARVTKTEQAAAALKDQVAARSGRESWIALRREAEPLLVGLGLSRSAARALIADRNGLDWSIRGSGTRADPLVLVPVRTDPDLIAARIQCHEDGRQVYSEAVPIRADEESRHQPESTTLKPAQDAAGMEYGFRPAEVPPLVMTDRPTSTDPTMCAHPNCGGPLLRWPFGLVCRSCHRLADRTTFDA